jgi:hypothetical protein
VSYGEEDTVVEAQYLDIGENNTHGICHDVHDVVLDKSSRVSDKDGVLALAKSDTKPDHDGEGCEWH